MVHRISRPCTLATRLTLVAGLLAPVAATNDGMAQTTQAIPAPPPAVTVVRVTRKAVTPSLTFTGRVEAVDKVDLRARVSGYLEQRLFQEGAEVKAGDLLFTIEKAPYQTTISEIEATIVRVQSTLKLAEIEVERQGTLVQRQATAQSRLDEAQAKLGEARGDLLRQQAALERARLDLSYTEIKAPIAGRVGRAAYSVGDFVGPESGALASIVAQDPVYATFPVTQRQLLDLRQRARDKGGDPRNVTIRLRLADGSIYPQTGRLDFVDVQVDSGTDSVQVRAQLPNPDRILIDGQLVTVVAEIGESEQALLIPQQALQADQGGTYVLIVDNERKAQVRRVQLGPRQGSEVVVMQGLAENDRVITEGVQKVRPQQPVDAAEAAGS